MSVSEIIAPCDYTPEIFAVIDELKSRMAWALIPYADEDILVLKYEGTIYVLANPVLGTEPIYNELGRVVDHVPLHNITLIYTEDWIKGDGKSLAVTIPRLRILKPELCLRISESGAVSDQNEALQAIIDEEEKTKWQHALDKLLREQNLFEQK
jgi:hypothetical protein